MVQIWKMGNGFAVSIDGETVRVVVEPTTGSHAPLSSDEKIIRALCSELAQAQEKAAALDMLEEMVRIGAYTLIEAYSGSEKLTIEIDTSIEDVDLAKDITAAYKQFKGE